MKLRIVLLLFLVVGGGSAGCLRNAFEFSNPCDRVDCDDDSICTSDRCTFDLSGDTTCHYDAVNDEAECDFDDVTLVCREGLCGAASLCDGVTCDDDNPCTVDACAWDGLCDFTPVACDDGNDCTVGRCDRETGACIFEPGDGVFGVCLAEEGAGDSPRQVGICEEGVCTGPCDSSAAEASECPPLAIAGFSCCPGSEYCQATCDSQPANTFVE